MKQCVLCKREKAASALRVCKRCIEERWEEAKEYAFKAHEELAKRYGLPYPVPRAKGGILCGECSLNCTLAPGQRGFCGLTLNEDGELRRLAGIPERAVVACYHDYHPTNCVAAPFCGASGIGYPKYSVLPHREFGYKSLAIFYGSCTYRCLYCQNYSWFEMASSISPTMSASEVAGFVDETTTCICFFGGCMPPQIKHAIETSRLARERKKGILRICSETNGTEKWKYLKQFAELSLESGGGIKFDLKAWSEELNIALSGITNKYAFENFERLGEMHEQREEVPFLRASTLLVPFYIDEEEVKRIAEFIASVDPSIPYALLAYYPHLEMRDLGFTSRELALRCKSAAEEAGLKRVKIGNVHLLV